MKTQPLLNHRSTVYVLTLFVLLLATPNLYAGKDNSKSKRTEDRAAELVLNMDPDGDGVAGSADLCPNTPEDADQVKDEDGCPETDGDNDGILDPEDGAPNDAEIFNNIFDADGVPDGSNMMDTDLDGIPNVFDKAPADPEDHDNFQDWDGVPDWDNDNDGILDIHDTMPNMPGAANLGDRKDINPYNIPPNEPQSDADRFRAAQNPAYNPPPVGYSPPAVAAPAQQATEPYSYSGASANYRPGTYPVDKATPTTPDIIYAAPPAGDPSLSLRKDLNPYNIPANEPQTEAERLQRPTAPVYTMPPKAPVYTAPPTGWNPTYPTPSGARGGIADRLPGMTPAPASNEPATMIAPRTTPAYGSANQAENDLTMPPPAASRAAAPTLVQSESTPGVNLPMLTFAKESTEISDEMLRQVNQIALILSNYPRLVIALNGYSLPDERMFTPQAHLGLQRAEAVKRQLILAHGISSTRMKTVGIELSDTEKTGQAQDRGVTARVVGELR